MIFLINFKLKIKKSPNGCTLFLTHQSNKLSKTDQED